MFGQTFELHDLMIVGLLVVLEGVLSIDNALVLGLLAKRLPHNQQAKALTYGLIGAFVFRIIAIATASWLLEWRIAKLLGGLYLVYIAVKHFFFEKEDDAPSTGLDPGNRYPQKHHYRFWPTVLVIELTDIAFAVDSILAAIAMISTVPNPDGGAHPKLWVVITGGMLGVILMRFAAVLFIRLLEKFPRFEMSAYLLVIVIGVKLCLDFALNKDPNHPVLEFHHPMNAGRPNWSFWIFWTLMLGCFLVGFIPHRTTGEAEEG